MDEIHNRNASTLSFEELYRNAYNLVLHKHGNLLYAGITDRLTVHLRQCGGRLVRLQRDVVNAAQSSSSSSNNTTGVAAANNKRAAMSNIGGGDSLLHYRLLEELSKSWTEHRITMVMVRDIFMYMDRTYVPQQRKRPVYDLGLWLFRRVVWERSMEDDVDEAEAEEDYHFTQRQRGGEAAGVGNHHHEYSNSNNNNFATTTGPIKSYEDQTTLGNVASSLILQVIHQDRLDRLDDAPQRMALLRSLVQMLLELAHASNGAYADAASSFRRAGGVGTSAASSSSGSSNMPVYERDFEEAFLGESQDFYRVESTSRLSHGLSSESINNSNNSSSSGGSSTNNNNDDDDGKPAAKYSAMEYVHRAQSRLEEERIRAFTLDLPASTRAALLRIVETELIERHARTLVEMEGSGFASILKVVASSPAVGSVAAAAAAGGGGGMMMMNMPTGGDSSSSSSESSVVIDHERIKDLAAMYDLFSRVPSSVNHLRDALSERIKIDGRALVKEQENNVAPPAAFVKGILAMRERFHAVVTDAMKGEKKAQKRMKESFEDFLNADARAANCLAVYVDELLRVGLRGADERKVSMELDRVIVIFRYLSDKDVFEAYYKNHLAKRLLGNKSGSEEAERAMVSLLKAECGYQFTSKLEGMFNDMRISKETAEKYRSHKKSLNTAVSNDLRDAENGGKPVDVEVSVLTTGYWPSQNVAPCILPPAVKAAMDRFQKYYLNTYTGRKLSWQTSTGSAEIRATFPPLKGSSKPRRHDLSVTTYQMCILVLFNNRDTLTLKQIRDETNIPEEELRRHLVSLCTPKHRILRKGSKGKGISGDDDTFTYNADYTSKMTKVKVPMVSMRDASSASAGAAKVDGSSSAAGVASKSAGLVDGSASVPLSVEEDRRHLLEAAIVRIMKARKVLNHNDLVAEVTRQLSGRFVPPPQFVKKRVESLIEREYLERDESDRRVYRYMA
jgi:cullin 3